MSQSRRMLAQAIRSLGFAAIGGGFTAIGTPLTNMVRILHITNLTDATLMFSFTGNTDHIILAANSFILLDFCSNKINDGGFFVSENTQMFIRQVGVPTSGTVYISAFHAFEVPRG